MEEDDDPQCGDDHVGHGGGEHGEIVRGDMGKAIDEEEANGVQGHFCEGHAKAVFGVSASRSCDRLVGALHFGHGEGLIGDDEVPIAHEALRGEVMPKSIAAIMPACGEGVDAEQEEEEMARLIDCFVHIKHWRLLGRCALGFRRCDPR